MPNQPREGTSAITFSMDDTLLERAEYLAEKLCEEHPGLRFTRFDAIRATLARNLPIPPADWRPKRSSSEARHQATAAPTTRSGAASTGAVSSSSAPTSTPAPSSSRRSARGAPSSTEATPPSSKRSARGAPSSAEATPPSSKRPARGALSSAEATPPSSKRARSRKAAEPVEASEDVYSTLEVPVFPTSSSKPSSKRPRR